MSNIKPQTIKSPKKKGKGRISKLVEGKTGGIYADDYNEYSGLGLEDVSQKRMNNTLNPRLKETFITINTLITTDKEKIYSVSVLVKDITTIAELIYVAIRKFNEEKLKVEDKNGKLIGTLYFKEDEDQYLIKPCKKTGKPKLDYPPFLATSTVQDTQSTNLALIYPPSSVLIKPINSKDRENMSCRDITCRIF